MPHPRYIQCRHWKAYKCLASPHVKCPLKSDLSRPLIRLCHQPIGFPHGNDSGPDGVKGKSEGAVLTLLFTQAPESSQRHGRPDIKPLQAEIFRINVSAHS